TRDVRATRANAPGRGPCHGSRSNSGRRSGSGWSCQDGNRTCRGLSTAAQSDARLTPFGCPAPQRRASADTDGPAHRLDQLRRVVADAVAEYVAHVTDTRSIGSEVTRNDDEVRTLAGLDGADLGLDAEHLCTVQGHDADDLGGREAALDQQLVVALV